MLETVPKAESYLGLLKKRLDGLGREAEGPLRRSR
jgi:hypothetical protein